MPSIATRARVPALAAAAASLVHVSPAVFAQRSAAALDPVVVTATRTPQRASDLVAEVTVLDRAAIERTEARTFAELVAQTPGIQFAANGGLGKSSSLFVRGLESRHVLLLVDGVRVGSATLGTPSLDNLPLAAIERIEIVRGPMTSLYGSGAMGAVIQVFTRRAGEQPTADARAAIGSHGYRMVGAGGSMPQPLAISAWVQHLANDGFSATNAKVPFGNFNPDDDGFRQNAGSVNASVPLPGRWRIDALALESRGTTQYDDGPGADTRARLRNSVQSLTAAGPVLGPWRTQLSYGRSVDVFDTVASASRFVTLGAIETTQAQWSWENTVRLPAGELLALAERVEQDVSRPGAPFAVSSRTIDAVALAYTLAAGPHDVQASLRRDRNSQFGGQTTGAAAYAFALTDAVRVGASYGQSFTAPSFNQLYFPGFGNPNLLPEEGEHYELFAAWRSGAQQVRLTGYEHRYRGFISAGPQPVNLPRVKITGATLAWQMRLDAWSVSGSADYVGPRNDTDGPNKGKRLPRRALATAALDVGYGLGAWDLGAALRAAGNRFDNAANTVRMGGYAVADLRADWRATRDVTVGLRLNNVLDKAYETAYGYNQAGREFYANVRWTLR